MWMDLSLKDNLCSFFSESQGEGPNTLEDFCCPAFPCVPLIMFFPSMIYLLDIPPFLCVLQGEIMKDVNNKQSALPLVKLYLLQKK